MLLWVHTTTNLLGVLELLHPFKKKSSRIWFLWCKCTQCHQEKIAHTVLFLYVWSSSIIHLSRFIRSYLLCHILTVCTFTYLYATESSKKTWLPRVCSTVLQHLTPLILRYILPPHLVVVPQQRWCSSQWVNAHAHFPVHTSWRSQKEQLCCHSPSGTVSN